MTLIDIFDDRYQHTGVCDKKTAHREALWHRTFSCLAINPTHRTVLLQKIKPRSIQFRASRLRRHHRRRALPRRGGHPRRRTGSPRRTRASGALHRPAPPRRPPDRGHPCPRLRRAGVPALAPAAPGRRAHRHPLADAEVAGLVELDLADALDLADDTRISAPARYAIRTPEGMAYHEGTLARTELVPNYLRTDQLYLRLFVAAHRYLTGERRHLFW